MRFLVNLFAFICFALSPPISYGEERSYTKIVTDDRGKPILKITCTYIGKKPIGPFNFSWDWRRRNTDFYNVIRENLTDKPIAFVRYKSYSKYPGKTAARLEPDSNQAKVVQSDIVIRDYSKHPMQGGNVLKPLEKRARENLFYSSTKSYNVRYYEMTIRYNGKEYSYIEYDVFKK